MEPNLIGGHLADASGRNPKAGSGILFQVADAGRNISALEKDKRRKKSLYPGITTLAEGISGT